MTAANKLAAAMALAVSLTMAATARGAEATHKHEEHGAHEHGVGRLDIAIEGSRVEIELRVPGADAVGFEHAPSSKEDRQAVKSAAAKLKDAGRVFRLPEAAGCKVKEVEVESAQLKSDHRAGDHGAHEHGHKEKEKESHAEFHGQYHFHCQDPKSLTYVDVEFFRLFPSARELDARWITPAGQGAAELTAKAARLNF